MRKQLTTVLCLVVLVALAGCEVTKTTDPNTGETTKTIALDTVVADKVEAIAETAVAGGAAASGFLPWLVPFVTAGAAGLATWKKIRPKLEKATNERDSYYKGGEVLASVLQDIKTSQPEVWEKIGPLIEEASKPVGLAGDAIRGFRHLPPKIDWPRGS